MPAESASVEDDCDDHHLSGNYKGLCLDLVDDDTCNTVCLAESSDNVAGACNLFQCLCWSKCTSEIIAADAASAPIPA
ncbi:unnamed protein product [Urochloa humidicola]